jgi:acetoin utilization protein AcuB
MHARMTTLVRDVMSRRPLTIDREARLTDAMGMMRANQIRHLPVVDDNGRLVGIITDRDLRSAAMAPSLAEFLPPELKQAVERAGMFLEGLRVKDAMTWSVVTTRPDASVPEAGAVMFQHRIGSLPVCTHGELVGIVTERDIYKALMSAIRPVRGADPDTFFW